MRFLFRCLLLLFLLYLPSVVVGQNFKIQGYCQQGGNRVQVQGISSSSGSTATYWQQSYPSCTVTVYNAGTTTPATIYSDSGGTPKSNPFTAASTGLWFFYVPASSLYDVRLSGGGIPTPFTLGDLISPGISGTGSVTSVATASPISGGTITTSGTISCPTCVTASSPGAGIAHFAGATQAVTSSQIINADVSASAGIVYSKLSLTNSIVNADIVNTTIDLTAKVTGVLPIANGGTNLNTAADDNVMLGNGTTWQSKAIPDCTDTGGNHLNYTASTNSFSCGTSGGGGSSITVGTTSIASGTGGRVAYETSGNKFGEISTLTSDGTVVTQKVGTNYVLADPTDATKKVQFDASNLTTGTTRTVNLPDASSTTVQADTGASNNFLTAISAQGVISKAQPSFSNISGTASLTTQVTGTLPVANGGTNLTTATDDNVMVGNGTTWQSKAVPDCQDSGGNHLNYTASTNTFSCGTTGGSATITVGTTAIASGTGTRVVYETSGNKFGEISGFTSDGTSVTAGSGNLTATRPKFVTSIDDSNGNAMITLTATGSAVNNFKATNAATGNPVKWEAIGSDSDVGMLLVAKGARGVTVGTTATKSMFQISNTFSLFETNTGTAAGSQPNFGRNVYFDGSVFKRIVADNEAFLIQLLQDGSMQWFQATDAGNTADSTITFTSRLTVDNSGRFIFDPITFANLGTPSNGAFVYCSDCTIANPCASGGNGAFAKRLNGAWVCN